MTTHESTPNDEHDASIDDVNAANETAENANPEDNDDVSAGEQVLDEGDVTPSQDDFLDDSDREGDTAQRQSEQLGDFRDAGVAPESGAEGAYGDAPTVDAAGAPSQSSSSSVDESDHDAGGGDPGDKHAAEERTDPGAPPAQDETPG